MAISWATPPANWVKEGTTLLTLGYTSLSENSGISTPYSTYNSPKSALRGQTMRWIGAKFWFLYVPGFQRQAFEEVKSLSERSKRLKEQKKKKRSVLVAESAYDPQNAQFGLVMIHYFALFKPFSPLVKILSPSRHEYKDLKEFASIQFCKNHILLQG